MHDPSTVAFEIKSPLRRRPDQLWPKGYRPSLVTIWHEDPLNFDGKVRRRDDDSCGWHTPPYSPADRERVKKLAKSQYDQIFAKQVATKAAKSYAYVCFEPDCQAAIYWSWRAIKHEFVPDDVWQYNRLLTAAEKDLIYDLATCPVDNLQMTFKSVKDLDSFEDLFFCVFHAFIRHHRPWWKHPRWHFWHWRFQVHPWWTLRRWLFTRCAGCGKRLPWGYSPVGFQWDPPRPKMFCGEVGVYHSECANLAVSKPEGTA
jgi:hypothetical protein